MAKNGRKFWESVRAWVAAIVCVNQNPAETRRILSQLEDLQRTVTVLQNQQGVIMATVAELQAEITALNEASAAERLEVQNKLTELQNQVKALQDQIAAGGGATAADLDSLLASIQAVKASITQISEPNV
jgi:chromosome segregation ATPase